MHSLRSAPSSSSNDDGDDTVATVLEDRTSTNADALAIGNLIFAGRPLLGKKVLPMAKWPRIDPQLHRELLRAQPVIIATLNPLLPLPYSRFQRAVAAD